MTKIELSENFHFRHKECLRVCSDLLTPWYPYGRVRVKVRVRVGGTTTCKRVG